MKDLFDLREYSSNDGLETTQKKTCGLYEFISTFFTYSFYILSIHVLQRHHVNNVFKKEHLIFVYYDGRKIVILATIFHIINQQTFPILDMHLHIYSDFIHKILLAYTALCIFFVTVILLNFLSYKIFLTKVHLYIN